MIPYFELHTIQLGPVAVQVWGLMVALGLLVGAKTSEYMLKRRGLDHKIIWEVFIWIVIGSFVLARIFHIVFYDLGFFIENPLEIISFWHGGLSISGGFIGALVAGLLFLKKKNLNFWSYADSIVFGLPLGLFIGRIGCFLIHDHPGKITDFFLGVQYPNGLAHHDHGLYLSLNGLLLALVFVFMAWRKVKEGAYLSVFLVWYGVVRFSLDFLRATDGAIVDNRYLGFTPAQYVSIVMILTGLFLFTRFRQSKD